MMFFMLYYNGETMMPSVATGYGGQNYSAFHRPKQLVVKPEHWS